MAGVPTEASLHALVDKASAANEKCRYARAADLFKRAALQASVLYLHDSLITVELKHFRASTLLRYSTIFASRLSRKPGQTAWCIRC